MTFFSHSLFSSSDKERYLALDIGTDAVKALVFRVDKKENRGFVLGVGRKKQRTGDVLGGGVADIDGVVATAREALDEAMRKARVKKIDRALLGIAGELVKGTTTTVHYERMRPETKIDVAEMREIMRRVQEKAKDRIRGQIAWETGNENVNVELINAAVVSVRIDGYKVVNPIGFQGMNVSVGIFNAYAPSVHLGALETIADELDLYALSIVAEPYAVSRIFSGKDERDFHAVFIDVGGGTTDIAVVRGGSLEGTKMYAIGGQSFTKHLAQETGLSFERAEELKLAYAGGEEIEQAFRVSPESVAEVLFDDARLWLGGLELSLEEFTKNDVLPGTILLCGGGTAIPEMERVLSDESWRKRLFFPAEMEIRYLLPKDVVRMEDLTKELVSPQDVTPLALANLMIEVLSEEKTLSNMLRRTAGRVNG
jgi:cell division protein FtsA